MWNRQNTHLQKSKWRNEINKIEYYELKNKNSMEFLEIYLINKFMPKYNVKDKNGYDLSWMDEGCSNFKFKEYKHGDVVKIEYNTKKEYKKNIVKHKENVLHKPNQMISINKTTLTPLQNSIIDLFLYVMQEYKLNNISTQSEDMFDEFFELDIYKYRKLLNLSHLRFAKKWEILEKFGRLHYPYSQRVVQTPIIPRNLYCSGNAFDIFS
jgi:hypothetical protein